MKRFELKEHLLYTNFCRVQVLVAHKEVMSWIKDVMTEPVGFTDFYDWSRATVNIDLPTLTVTSTYSTTRLDTVK